jgi:hypothetical protein
MRGGMYDAGGASSTPTVSYLPASSGRGGFRFANWERPISIVLAASLSSPRSPERTMRIFFDGEPENEGLGLHR